MGFWGQRNRAIGGVSPEATPKLGAINTTQCKPTIATTQKWS